MTVGCFLFLPFIWSLYICRKSGLYIFIFNVNWSNQEEELIDLLTIIMHSRSSYRHRGLLYDPYCHRKRGFYFHDITWTEAFHGLMKVSKLHARGGVVSAPSVLAMNVLDLKVCLSLFLFYKNQTFCLRQWLYLKAHWLVCATVSSLPQVSLFVSEAAGVQPNASNTSTLVVSQVFGLD